MISLDCGYICCVMIMLAALLVLAIILELTKEVHVPPLPTPPEYEPFVLPEGDYPPVVFDAEGKFREVEDRL